MNQILNYFRTFAREEEGAQVIEYALIIAVVSIALVLGLATLNDNWGNFIQRVADCLNSGATCA